MLVSIVIYDKAFYSRKLDENKMWISAVSYTHLDVYKRQDFDFHVK